MKFMDLYMKYYPHLCIATYMSIVATGISMYFGIIKEDCLMAKIVMCTFLCVFFMPVIFMLIIFIQKLIQRKKEKK